jgi:hypothetical protein
MTEPLPRRRTPPPHHVPAQRAEGHTRAAFAFPADDPRKRAVGVAEPSPDLLDRALAGWNRFLSSLPVVADE